MRSLFMASLFEAIGQAALRWLRPMPLIDASFTAPRTRAKSTHKQNARKARKARK